MKRHDIDDAAREMTTCKSARCFINFTCEDGMMLSLVRVELSEAAHFNEMQTLLGFSGRAFSLTNENAFNRHHHPHHRWLLRHIQRHNVDICLIINMQCYTYVRLAKPPRWLDDSREWLESCQQFHLFFLDACVRMLTTSLQMQSELRAMSSIHQEPC